MPELNNVRHETFAQCIAKGDSQRQAYYAAYPKSKKWKEESVDPKASALMKNDKVVTRVKELAEATTSKAVMTARERKEWLTEIIKSKEEYTKDKLKAVDILNRMEGEYIDKVELNGQINNPMAGLTTEELKKLVNDG